MSKEKKESVKNILVRLIPSTLPSEGGKKDINYHPMYRMMNSLIKHNHHELKEAKIGLAWRKRYRPDKDGHLVLGMCHKTSDLEKELRHFDFIILLNKEVWNDDEFDVSKQKALLDHELCHAAAVITKKGKHKKDSRGRQVFRIRKHDIEEFRDIVERHGCYKRDLELFAEALLKKRKKS